VASKEQEQIWSFKPKTEAKASPVEAMELIHAQPLLNLNSVLHPVRESFWSNLEAFLVPQLWPYREHFCVQFLDHYGVAGAPSLLRRDGDIHAKSKPASSVRPRSAKDAQDGD